ncbi:MAG: PA2778 family cysteine peptidase [Spongiibacteraceae bacterium]|nr:PA2778 family cysteine peptidase [Spongiibacteraceae bacterium]
MSALRHWALLGLAALLSACAGPRISLPDAQTLAGLPSRHLLQDVPFFAQDAYQCGPAALAMMLNQRGIVTAPENLVARVYLPARKGSLQVEMVAAAREQGLLIYPLRPELSTLLEELAAGNPVLVMQNLALDWLPQWHYAVAVGYDLDRQTLLLHSGLHALQATPFDVFVRTWARADYWARLTLPPDRLPASAEPLAYLRAASDLEQTGQLAAAAQAYRAALTRWPDQPAARLGLGNVAWARGDRRGALTHFRALVRDFPAIAAGWNNLAVGLEAVGCPAQAARARRCLHAVQAAAGGEAAAHCAVPDCP